MSVVRSELSLAAGTGTFGARVAGAGTDDLKLFESFFETVTGAVAGPDHRQVFTDALAELDRKERAA